MNIENFRLFCMSKKGCSESFPFDESTLVFKVMDKMFALTDIKDDFSINIKCRPEKAILLREQYRAVNAGYHMSKLHWNTIIIDGSIPDSILNEWIDDSYNLVVEKLTKKQKILLLNM